MRYSRFPLIAGLFALGATGALAQTAVKVETVADGLENPWGLAFLPDGRMLVTEKAGRLRIAASDGSLTEAIAGVPEVMASGQGGLLDVAIDPDFKTNRLVYLSYAEAAKSVAGTAVARGTLSEDGSRLDDVQVIFRQEPKVEGRGHFGSRLAFAPDGTLFITVGDRQGFRDEAQKTTSHIGKVMRINADGSVPKDNPFVGQEGAKSEIWSIGHRNVQAAAINPATGKLWTVEHGSRGGDEINDPEAGKNYGWPVISYGVEYSGAKIGVGTAKEGMEQPIYYWDPSIAPSGMAFYTGDLFPEWKGSLFVGALKGQHLARLQLDGEKIVREEKLIENVGDRIRDVRQGPDGALYVLTDESKGRILRLTPGD
ncbi:glucose dehydrogenase [Agaricicola taiwanensis]|uniref:Glucose dehydrogenase n=1 Tax=Agaricicola taiwanensis TaxID=591372 RepID=A0A8J2YGQ6_9RHOB|nr:PQQ-dependent sugar dehydrogenase [Agaricicola taiwanensis]GGE40515.1 glucose dehydrogenase [Agaricicola taiwanensis]